MPIKPPRRIQRKRRKGWRMPPGAVYVGRGTEWGNPYIVGRDGTAEECVQKYIRMKMPYTKQPPHNTLEELFIGECFLLAVGTLRGKILSCWCKEGEPFHADFLLKEANERYYDQSPKSGDTPGGAR